MLAMLRAVEAKDDLPYLFQKRIQYAKNMHALVLLLPPEDRTLKTLRSIIENAEQAHRVVEVLTYLHPDNAQSESKHDKPDYQLYLKYSDCDPKIIRGMIILHRAGLDDAENVEFLKQSKLEVAVEVCSVLEYFHRYAPQLITQDNVNKLMSANVQDDIENISDRLRFHDVTQELFDNMIDQVRWEKVLRIIPQQAPQHGGLFHHARGRDIIKDDFLVKEKTVASVASQAKMSRRKTL